MKPLQVAGREPIGVLLADSNQTQSQLLVSALRRGAGFRVHACRLTGPDVLEAATAPGISVAILNLENPAEAWVSLPIVRELQLARPEVSQVVLLDSYNRELVIKAFRSGVRGLFCSAESPVRMLRRCIQCLHRGQIWANSQQLRYLLEDIAQVPVLHVMNSGGATLLTPRESQVAALVSEGLANREIAAELRLSEHTVKKYIFHIFDKLGISNRVELVLYAINQGEPRTAEWIAGGRC